MKTTVTHLKFRDAIHPELKRLPNGVRFVKQNDWQFLPRTAKYIALNKKGKIICMGAGHTIKEAKEKTLDALNKALLEVNLIWGNKATNKQYLEVL
jgi:predicted polyphosphate/ATP-dependent NAD kinase